MEDQIMCPECRKLNDPHKFCIFCGNKLPVSDAELELMKENPGPTCLNCGRPVEKGQIECECGYEFSDINCPKCNKENPYTNRFCTSCGKKLWTSSISKYKYDEAFFEKHLVFKKRLPYSLQYTSLYRRVEEDIKNPLGYMSSANVNTLQAIKLRIDEIDEHIYEICERWKVVSPNYCIDTLQLMDPNISECEICRFSFGDKKRDKSAQTSDRYTKPVFDMPKFKWASKSKGLYLLSLTPAIGESQLEYRERLKWEFRENKIIIEKLKELKSEKVKAIERAAAAEASRQAAKTTHSRKKDDSFEGEWELYCMTQDEWERQMREESRIRNEQWVERGKKFWGN